ncbi:hypothetical protein MAHJHV51_53350 [Mycobacterium avium subsp. hominissuis]
MPRRADWTKEGGMTTLVLASMLGPAVAAPAGPSIDASTKVVIPPVASLALA